MRALVHAYFYSSVESLSHPVRHFLHERGQEEALKLKKFLDALLEKLNFGESDDYTLEPLQKVNVMFGLFDRSLTVKNIKYFYIS